MSASSTDRAAMGETFFEVLDEGPFVVADGAMGTNLMVRGLEAGDAPELWNLEHRDRVLDVHHEFVAAGSRILLTNSFGADSVRLRRAGAADRAFELNVEAARIAREAAASAPYPVAVGGSMGPTGELFAPSGPLTEEEAERAFVEQARGLVAGGADALWLETMYDETEFAIAAAAAATTGKPVVATMTFDQGGRTMMGVAPESACRLQSAFAVPPTAFGANCGAGLANNVAAIVEIAATAAPGTIIVAKPNCGIPVYRDGKVRYDGTPERMAVYARLVRDAGARIIGGCCGSTGAHLDAMVEALEGYAPGAPPSLEEIETALGPVQRAPKARTGKRKGGH